MRVAGESWESIATALGMKGGAPAAHRAVSRYFGRVPQPDREMLRGVARARGEHLWRRALGEVERTEGAPAAVRAAVDVLRRHAALDGLDDPVRIDINDPSAEEFRRFVELAARGAGYEVPQRQTRSRQTSMLWMRRWSRTTVLILDHGLTHAAVCASLTR